MLYISYLIGIVTVCFTVMYFLKFDGLTASTHLNNLDVNYMSSGSPHINDKRVRELYVIMVCSLVPRLRREGKSGLVTFAYACASNTIVLSIKLSGIWVGFHMDCVWSKYIMI